MDFNKIATNVVGIYKKTFIEQATAIMLEEGKTRKQIEDYLGDDEWSDERAGDVIRAYEKANPLPGRRAPTPR